MTTIEECLPTLIKNLNQGHVYSGHRTGERYQIQREAERFNLIGTSVSMESTLDRAVFDLEEARIISPGFLTEWTKWNNAFTLQYAPSGINLVLARRLHQGALFNEQLTTAQFADIVERPQRNARISELLKTYARPKGSPF